MGLQDVAWNNGGTGDPGNQRSNRKTQSFSEFQTKDLTLTELSSLDTCFFGL